MIDLDRAVLYFGIAAVVAVATFNNVHANAAQPTAVAEPRPAQVLKCCAVAGSGPEWTELKAPAR